MDEVGEIAAADYLLASSIQEKLRDVELFPAVLFRPWWTRIWIIQETILARDPWILCGIKKIPWKAISTVCEILQGRATAHQTGDEFMAWWPELEKMIWAEDPGHTNTPILDTWMWCFSRLRRLNAFRNQAWSHGNERSYSLSSMNALNVTMAQLASDPHDKVYGLIGLVQPDERKKSGSQL
jgi:hypothetical protein